MFVHDTLHGRAAGNRSAPCAIEAGRVAGQALSQKFSRLQPGFGIAAALLSTARQATTCFHTEQAQRPHMFAAIVQLMLMKKGIAHSAAVSSTEQQQISRCCSQLSCPAAPCLC
jgi:hypothetical protein